MESESERERSNHFYEKGYFLDFTINDCNWQQFRIKDIIGNKLVIENLACTIKYNVDINSTKLRPFRFQTKPLDQFRQEENQCAPSYVECLETLKRINKHHQMASMSSFQIIQYFRGSQHYMMINLMGKKIISHQKIEVLEEFVKQFFLFFGSFWRLINVKAIPSVFNIYQSSQLALLSSFPQILIDLKLIVSLCQKTVQNASANPLKSLVQNWLLSKFIPSIVEQQLTVLNVEQLLKVMYVLIQCNKTNLLQSNKSFQQSKNKIFNLLKSHLQITTIKKYDEYSKIVKNMMDMFNKKTFDFSLCKQLYLTLLIRFLDLANEPFFINSHSSSRYDRLSNNISFVFEEIKHNQNNEMTKKYLHHDNGLLFYIKSITTEVFKSEFKKLHGLVGDYVIRCLIKLKKIQMIKQVEKWTISMLNSAVSQYLKNQETKNDDLGLAVEIHKITNNLNKIVFGSTLTSISQQQQQKQDMEQESKNTVDLIDAGQNDDVIVEEKNRSASRSDNDVIMRQRQILVECQNRIENRIITLCQILYDSPDKPFLIPYVENHIIMKSISNNSVEFMDSFDSKESSIFKEVLMFGNYLKKLQMRKNSPDFQDCIKSAFKSLVETMLFIKNKQLFEFRRQNIKSLIKCGLSNFPSQQSISMICFYVEKIKYVPLKQSKVRSFDFIQELLSGSPIYQSKPLYVEAITKILSHMRIDTLGQFKIYHSLFNYVNSYQKKLKVHAASGMAVSIYDVPDGINGFIQILHNWQIQKSLMKKAVSFLHRIQFKILSISVRSKILHKICESLVQSLTMISKLDVTKIQDMIKEIVNMIDSLMSEQQQFNTQNSYDQLFQIESHAVLLQKKGDIYQIMITLEGHCKEEELDMEDEEKSIYLEASAHQRMFTIKSKASSQFKISPLDSNFFVQDKKIQLTEQQITIHEFIKCFPSCLKNPQMNKQHEEKPKTGQQHKKYVYITIKPAQFTILKSVKEFFMNNLDKIFHCLPYSKIIWARLKVSSEDWFQNEKLIHVRQSFLKCCQQKGYKKDPLWISIMNSPLKKMFLLDALLQDDSVHDIHQEWLFETFGSIRSRIDIQNNLNSVQLIEKVKVELTSNNTTCLLDMLLIDNSNDEMKEIENDELYHNLVQKTMSFIKNEAKFAIFNFFMNLSISFLKVIEDNNLLSKWVHFLLEQQFYKFVSQNRQEFDLKMLHYLQKNTLQFQYFINILQTGRGTKAEQRDFFNEVYTSWLSSSINYLIKKKKVGNILSNENLAVTRNTLILISCLVEKQIKCQLLFCEQFKSVLLLGLTQKLSIEAIKIIKFICLYSIKEGEQYVNFFQLQMREPHWQMQQQIRFHRKNMKGASGFVGLRNLDSICYANSLFQQLYNIVPFRQRIYETDWKVHQYPQEDLIFQLKKIFLNLQYLQSNDYVNETFFEAFKNDEGGPTNVEVQMDVDQFRSILFDRIQNLVLKKQGETQNFVQQIFNGKQVTLIKSKECQHSSSKEEDFSTICLEVKGLKNLQNSLQHYFKAEILDGDDKYSCENCKKKVVAEKMLKIKQYPPYLTFVLKRFEFVMMQFRKKVNEKFQFPLAELAMSPHDKYRLKGIIIHQGISEAGHYFSIIRINERWYKFNDTFVTEISPQIVVALSFGQQTPRCNRNAYLLIYEKTQQNTQKIQKQQFSLPKFKGMEEQWKEVHDFNRVVWKSDLFLSSQFDKFIQVCVQNKVKGSNSLLLQYILTIKSKIVKPDLTQLKHNFSMLKNSMNGPILTSEKRVNWVICFYWNRFFDHSIKSALSEIIASSHFVFDDDVKKLLKECLLILHNERETGPFFNLMYALCKNNIQVIKYLNQSRIIGRILDITITKFILTHDREELSKSSLTPFPLIDQVKIQKQKMTEDKKLRYHKWRLVNLILSANLNLHSVQLSYLETFNERRFISILDDATTKASLNQISKFFIMLSARFPKFASAYLDRIVESISQHESENAKKYLKFASDLLGINDQKTTERAEKIKSKFAIVLNELWRQKMSFSFDIKWQWFIKMGLKHSEFRRIVKESENDFKVINSKSELQLLYSRNNANSETRQKNRYYGLLFGSTNSIEKKYEMSRLIFEGDEQKVRIQNEQIDYDKDLTDYPDLFINSKTYIRKYNDQSSKFIPVEVEEIVGDLLRIDDQSYDRGDQRLMPYFPALTDQIQGQQSS